MLKLESCVRNCVIWALLVVPALSKTCEKRDRCSCVYDDGSGMIDISNVGYKTGNPRFLGYTSVVDAFLYSFNPCFPFTEGTCTNAAVCLNDYQNFLYYDIGNADNVEFEYDGSKLFAVYTSADGTKTSYMELICDPGRDVPFAAVIGESTPNKFYLHVDAEELCLKPTPQGWGKNQGLSAGSILLIVFFVVGAVYLIAGMTFLKVKQDAKGKDMVPNIGFWSELPGLVKDGCAFATGIVCRKRSVYVKNTSYGSG